MSPSRLRNKLAPQCAGTAGAAAVLTDLSHGPPGAAEGASMKAPDLECMGYACECVRLAGLSPDPQIRDQLLRIAQDWMATAMHVPRLLEDVPAPRRN